MRPAIWARPWVASISIFLISVCVLSAVTIVWGASKKLDPGGGDGSQYLGIAQSLSNGTGFKDPVGAWPDRPDYERMPGWPFILSIVLRIVPGAPPEAVSRFTNVVCLALAGTFFGVLARRLGVCPELSILAGLAISLSPSLVYLSVSGASEIAFVLIVSLGIMLIIAGGAWTFTGCLVLGLGPLIRTNFVLFPFVLFTLALLSRSNRHTLLRQRNLARGILAGTLILMPSLLWAVRNYSITGRFPLLSAIEGETLYGANNDIVANDLTEWGYWVMPDEIPGEIPKLKLAKIVPNALALNDYYHRQAVTWIKHHVSAMPRLILGKFVRAFAPIPWKPSALSFVAFLARFLLYPSAFLLLPYWWGRIRQEYILFLASMIAVHLVTVTLYYGQFRFSHCFIEIFLVPCIFLGLQNWHALRYDAANKIALTAAT